MTRWDDTTEGIWTQVWDQLARGVAEASAPARRPVMATIGLDGGPEARIVVLRGADRAAATCVFHTDTATEKCKELQANPAAALHVWDRDLALQTRLTGRISLRPASAEEWAATPDVSRGNYGTEPVPSTPIASFADFTRVPDPARMTVMVFEATRLDAVILAEDVHRRAQFQRVDGWRGQWVVP